MKQTLNTELVIPQAHNLTLRETGAALTQAEKISQITFHFKHIMQALGLDLNDDSLRATPDRVAKMFVAEIFAGLDADAFPKISLFDNTYGYRGMLVEKNIEVFSMCEHHFMPFMGKAHVAYMPGDKVIGLSKLNRIVKYFCRRPQVQERLTTDIAASLRSVLHSEDVAVMIEARHMCVAARGIEDTKSATVTSCFTGKFSEAAHQQNFYASLK